MLAEVRRVDLVHPREVVEALQEDRRLHDAVEAAPCFLEDRAEVGEDLLGLLLDRAAAQLRVSRLERELTGDEDKARSLDRLRVRRSLERRRRGLGADDLLQAFSLLRGRHACASATPSALKIASRTCWVSLPSIRRTCSVRRALCASSSRKRPRGRSTNRRPAPRTDRRSRRR